MTISSRIPLNPILTVRDQFFALHAPGLVIEAAIPIPASRFGPPPIDGMVRGNIISPAE